MKWESTTQERISGFLIQFEVYHQPGKPQPYKALAYHGPYQVAHAQGKTPAQAREHCRAAYVASESAYLPDLP